jgi:hypothetical protein
MSKPIRVMFNPNDHHGLILKNKIKADFYFVDDKGNPTVTSLIGDDSIAYPSSLIDIIFKHNKFGLDNPFEYSAIEARRIWNLLILKGYKAYNRDHYKDDY